MSIRPAPTATSAFTSAARFKPMTGDSLGLSAEQVLTTTRSVRRRLDIERPVERAVVEQCLETALQAPNGSNMNTWRWVLVDDRDTIAAMSAIYSGAMDDFVAMLGDATGADYMGAHIPGYERISASVDHLRQNLHSVPVVVIPLLAGRVEGLNAFYQASQWGSILQAVWSLMLALRNRGLGSAWTTAHLWREQDMAELLGIPCDRYTQVGLFPVAYTLGTDFKPAWRKPVSEVAHWNQFSE